MANYGYEASDFAGKGTGGGGGFPPMTQGTPTDKKRVSEQQSVTPLTCYQVLNAEHMQGEVFKVNGRPLNHIVVFGRLKGWASEGQKNIKLCITDGTGTLQVKLFGSEYLRELQENSSTPPTERMRLVRVFGHIRMWQGEISVIAICLKLEKNYDLMMHHFLSCIYAKQYHKHGPLDPPPRPNLESGTQPASSQQALMSVPGLSGMQVPTAPYAPSYQQPHHQQHQEAYRQPQQHPQQHQYGAPQYQQQQQPARRGINEKMKAAIQAIVTRCQHTTSEGGIHVEQLRQEVAASGFPMAEFQATLDAMNDEGSLYDVGEGIICIG